MNNVFPIISIIVPVYKVERYIRRCIDSILAQTYTDWELLLVDDGSPDNSGAICDEYVAKDSRIRVFHKPNGGVSSARNFGIEKAKGEWVSFIDADDWIEKTFVEHMMQGANADMVIAQGMVKFGKVVDCFLEGGKIYLKENFNQIVNVLLRPNSFFFPPWGRAFRLSKIRAIGIYYPHINYCEDQCFNLEYIKYCDSIYIAQDKGYHYEENEGSLSHSEKPWRHYMVFLPMCLHNYLWYRKHYNNLGNFTQTMVDFHIIYNSLLILQQVYRKHELRQVRYDVIRQIRQFVEGTQGEWKRVHQCASSIRFIKHEIIFGAICRLPLTMADLILKFIH